MDAISDVEDEAFLSQVAAVEEAFALSAKRRKISSATAAADSPKQPSEGAYTAALRGSNSLVFQNQNQQPSRPNPRGISVSSTNADSVGGGSCYKCGKPGHWSRDCDSVASGGGGGAAVDPTVPVKACPCGVGDCNVLTANTEKNRGRKFYKCPLREENGGCGFFEWCDKSMETGLTTLGSQSCSLNPSIPELSCPCGAGSCLILTAKTEKNLGRQFYRCPANQGSSCGFFKFCDDRAVTPNFSDTLNAYKVHNTNEMNKSFGVRSGSSCYKCGKDGHWAKDCVQSSFQPIADLGAKSAAPSGACYKCGKPGHWAKDCSSGADARERFRQ